MRKIKNVGIRETQIHLTKLLRKLPFKITRYGKPIAKVIPIVDKDNVIRSVEPIVSESFT